MENKKLFFKWEWPRKEDLGKSNPPGKAIVFMVKLPAQATFSPQTLRCQTLQKLKSNLC